MIILQKGNILDALKDDRIGAIAHGVNCSGGFGSGIAGQIAQQYPEVREAYLKKYNDGKIYSPYGWFLGDIQPVKVQVEQPPFVIGGPPRANHKPYYETKYIINCATQKNYGSDGTQYVDYGAIRDCIQSLKLFSNNNFSNLAIPKIGTGLGGGDWETIENIILNIFHDINISIYVL